MLKSLFHKLKEAAVSVFPVAIIVLLLNLTPLVNFELTEMSGAKRQLNDDAIIANQVQMFMLMKKYDRAEELTSMIADQHPTLRAIVRCLGGFIDYEDPKEAETIKLIQGSSPRNEVVINLYMAKFDSMSREALLDYISQFRDDNIFAIAELLRRGESIESIHEITKITAFFLEAIKNIVDMEFTLKANIGDTETLVAAKKMGFSDKFIARLWGKNETDIFCLRKEKGIFPVFRMVDTCHTGAYIPYFYSSYHGENASRVTDKKKIVVLDDDPTGVQTVHDISVYTGWDLDSIREGFAEEGKLFYILTNSRGLTVAQTTQVHQDIARRVAEVSRETGKDFILMSRSDSTLRGHYPLEPRLLKDIVEDGIIEFFYSCLIDPEDLEFLD